MSSFQGFAHRRNPDETFDSICRSCFATVGSHRPEWELEGIERRHICDPRVVERFQETSPGSLTRHDSAEQSG